MGWITYDEVKAKWAAEIADPRPSGDFSLTAAQIVETLDTCYLDAVKTSHEPSVLKIYNSHGCLLVQSVTKTVTMYKGLERDLAERIANGLHSDNTVAHKWSAVYSATWANNTYSDLDFDVFEFTAGPTSSTTSSWSYKPGGKGNGISRSVYLPTDGRLVEAMAARANEADGWTATVTATLYAAPTYTAGSVFWPATPPVKNSTGTGDVGNVLSVGTRSQFLFAYSGYPLIETTVTTVTEYRNLTYDQARAIAGTATSANWKKAQYKSSSGAAASYTMAVRSDTESVIDARYVDDDHGWTATVTSTVYSHNTGTSYPGWSIANL